ncbi:MAG: tetratricopeptide repeat protein, partial [Pseudomonadota bacterium]
MRLPPFRAAPMACALFLALAACDTAEERAEGHFESALDLIEAGDVARAKVELRTVFSLVPDHKAARETFAKLLYDEGDFAAAFGQYNRLVEEDPDALLARYVVAELLVLDNEFDAAQEHLDAVQRLAPSEARAQILANVTAYRDAVLGEDIEARRAAGARALELAENLPESRVNNTVIADALILDERYDQLYDQLDRIIALYPEERRFHVFRLTAYGRQEDNAGIERTMRDMIEAFPDDETLPQSMMRFYSSQGDLDGAEEFLRSRIVPGQADDGFVAMHRTSLRSAQMCHPQERNTAGNVFGGVLLRRALEHAFATAFRFAGAEPLLAEIQRVDFLKPVHVGSLLA